MPIGDAPPGATVTASDDALVVRWRLLDAYGVFVAMFAMVWNLFVLQANTVWIAIADNAVPWYEELGFFAIAIPIDLAAISVGACLGGAALVLVVNHSQIRADGHVLEASSGPLWPRSVQVVGIRSLYIAPRRPARYARYVPHDVVAVDDTGHATVIVSGLTPQFAAWLHGALLRRLGVESSRPNVEDVPGMDVDRSTGLAVSWAWARIVAFKPLLVAFALGGTAFAGIVGALVEGAYVEPVQWLWLFGFGLVLTLAVALLYMGVAYLVNRTTVEVYKGWLHLRFDPIPWPGSGEVSLEGVDQLYVVRRGSLDHRGLMVYTWELHALRGTAAPLIVLTGLDTFARALTLERGIEDHLGIANRPVSGETEH